ncbi:MAG: hypothetical protein MR517_04915 [Bacteroidales bacterium]|nr:hypothetical protein [Bacteroidales bacterium]
MALNDLKVIEIIFFYDCRNIRMQENADSAENSEKKQQEKEKVKSHKPQFAFSLAPLEIAPEAICETHQCSNPQNGISQYGI